MGASYEKRRDRGRQLCRVEVAGIGRGAATREDVSVKWWKRAKWHVTAARHAAVWRAVHWGWREFQRAGIVTADTPAWQAFKSFGRGSIMAFPPGSFYGKHAIEVGEDTLIGQLVTMSAGMLPGQDFFGL